MNLQASPKWRPTHRHKKGGLYRKLGQAVLETDRSDVVIYDDADGTVWVRPIAEFSDNARFTPLSPPLPRSGAAQNLGQLLRRVVQLGRKAVRLFQRKPLRRPVDPN